MLSVPSKCSDDPAAGQGGSPRGLVDLQATILHLDGVVPVDHALLLDRKNAVQVPPRTGQKRAAALDRLDGEAAVALPDIVLAQEAVGLVHRD